VVGNGPAPPQGTAPDLPPPAAVPRGRDSVAY